MNAPLEPDSEVRDRTLMRRAIALSDESIDEGGGPFGAVVVQSDRIVGEGKNSVIASNDPTAHAEIVAIRQACRNLNTFRLSGCRIYSSCEPCPMCGAAILWARLDEVIYANSQSDAASIGFDDERFHRSISASDGASIMPTRRFLAKEAIDVFHRWQNSSTKRPY